MDPCECERKQQQQIFPMILPHPRSVYSFYSCYRLPIHPPALSFSIHNIHTAQRKKHAAPNYTWFCSENCLFWLMKSIFPRKPVKCMDTTGWIWYGPLQPGMSWTSTRRECQHTHTHTHTHTCHTHVTQATRTNPAGCERLTERKPKQQGRKTANCCMPHP